MHHPAPLVPLLAVFLAAPLAAPLALGACTGDAAAPEAGKDAGGSPGDPFVDYMRRSKTAEAKVHVDGMVRAATSYFEEEHVAPGGSAVALHQCPDDGSSSGETGITPPLTTPCSKGPGGRCAPVGGAPAGPGEYPITAWTEHPVWSALGFHQETSHYFHYNFKWANEGVGTGKCQFTAQAFGDLDDDGVYSTYERVGRADERGVSVAEPHIEHEVE